MATWGDASEDTLKAINDVILKTDLDRYISIKLITNSDQKEVGKLKKLTPDVKFALGDDLMIIINEEIFEQLPPPQQNMYVEELMCGVSFDTENDRLTINQPDVKTHSGFLQKYTYEIYEVMQESIKSLYDKKKEDDAQNDG